MTANIRGRLSLVLAPLMAACSVPDLEIQELVSPSTALDGSAAASDAGAQLDAGGAEAGSADAGRSGRTGEPVGGAAADSGAAGNAGGAGAAGRAGSGGAGTMSQPSAAGVGGAAGSAGAAGGSPARACAVWVNMSVGENMLPPGAVEGGFENVAGVSSRQYVCRFRPEGSSYSIPGKLVVGLGCYVTRRVDTQPADASMLQGKVDVLTPAPGCSFSWRVATPAQLPEGTVDLGDPAGGRNFACRGDYSDVASNGKQIGTIIPSLEAPALNQCWFESFSNAIQPTEPAQFEVLVQDP